MTMANINEEFEEASETVPEIDAKYRLIILAAKRSKQLQRGARPRIDIDADETQADAHRSGRSNPR